MKKKHMFLAVLTVCFLIQFTACSDWQPEACPGGLRCPSGSTCTLNVDHEYFCNANHCGNGILELEHKEHCDDGNLLGNDGCTPECKGEYCGNNFEEEHEVCDDGNQVPGDGCDSTCMSKEVCGNGVTDTTEACDDGNTESGDRCSSDCKSKEICGNGIHDSNESCDCGSKNVIADSEECGGQQNSDTSGRCTTECKLNCGDGQLDEGEECDGEHLAATHCIDGFDGTYDMGVLGCDTSSCKLDVSACRVLDRQEEVVPYDNPIEWRDIWATDENNIYIVGDNGGIYHFDGQNWNALDTSTTASLFGIWGDGVGRFFAVGKEGIVLQHNGTILGAVGSVGHDLLGVWGSSTSNVFAVGLGGRIWHYVGTPLSWNEMTSPGPKQDLADIWGSGAKNVYAVGKKGKILRYHLSASGVLAWANVPVPDTSEIDIAQIDFEGIWGSGPNDIFVVGRQGVILHYDGLKWSAERSPTGDALLDVWGTAPNDVFAAGRGGTILHYDGSKWSRVRSNTNADFHAGWSTQEDIFVVGEGGNIFHFERQSM
jgi:cysteine-rich repeat protein